MVLWEICGTRHNELDGMRASNSPPPPAKVNSDCIGKNYPLSGIIITIVKICHFALLLKVGRGILNALQKHDRSSMHCNDL